MKKMKKTNEKKKKRISRVRTFDRYAIPHVITVF